MLGHASEVPQLKTASTHPMQYYLSLPEHWVAGKRWPVVVVIESAEREFLQAATAMSVADAHGYKNVSLTRVEGKGHERLAEEVLAYFSSLTKL